MSLTRVHLSEDARLLLDFARSGKRICFSSVRGALTTRMLEDNRDCTVALSELVKARLIRVAEVEEAVAGVWYEAVPEREIE